MLDILLGRDSSSLGKLLKGKNSAILLALLPVLLQLLSSKQSSGLLGQQGSKSGLEGMLGSLSSGGLGDIVGSWVGAGPNKRITQSQVQKGLGPDTISKIAKQAGLSPADTTKGLSALLPALINELTPKAQVPQASALDNALSGLSGLLPKL